MAKFLVINEPRITLHTHDKIGYEAQRLNYKIYGGAEFRGMIDPKRSSNLVKEECVKNESGIRKN